MTNLFVCTSFSGHVNYETRCVNPDYRESIASILDAIRSVGKLSVFCAIEHEGWIVSDKSAGLGVKKDLDELDKSDAVLALPPAGIVSGGLQYEMGYADGKGKQLIVATEQGVELAYFNEGIVELGRAEHIIYDGGAMLAQQVSDIVLTK